MRLRNYLPLIGVKLFSCCMPIFIGLVGIQANSTTLECAELFKLTEETKRKPVSLVVQKILEDKRYAPPKDLPFEKQLTWPKDPRRFQKFSRAVNAQTMSYNPDVTSPAYNLASQRDKMISVWQGKGASQGRGFAFLSKGFDTCHAILIKDPQSQRFALLHFWSEFEPLQEELLRSFPKSSSIILFGNENSVAIDVSQNELRLFGFENVRALRIEESGRWNFAFDTVSSRVIYENTDQQRFIQIEDFFTQTDFATTP